VNWWRYWVYSFCWSCIANTSNSSTWTLLFLWYLNQNYWNFRSSETWCWIHFH